MAQIEVNKLNKIYRRKVQSEGFGHLLRDFFVPKYEDIHAVKDLSFSIDAGEMVGYIGPNGSGKSTTIKMLSGILSPSYGQVTVAGRIPTVQRIANNAEIGVVFGQRSLLWWDVPIIESYNLLRVLYEIPKAVYEENLAMLSEVLGIKDLLYVPERQLSLGQKMRCNIAGAFLHNPKIVFLDEPTVGVDVFSKAEIRKLIQKINKEKKTTFIITSHDFHDIEALCQRLIIINKGMIVADTSVEEIRKEYGKNKTLRFTLSENSKIKVEDLKIETIENLRIENNILEFDYDITKQTVATLINQVSQQVSISDIAIVEPSIEYIIAGILKEK